MGSNPRKHPLYTIWKGMRGRCYSPNNSGYADYGGRGIRVSTAWSDFLVFYNWAMKAEYRTGLSLDRIDVNGDYSSDNCRWATYREQGNNTRRNRHLTAFDETKTISYWSDDVRCAVPLNTLYQRIESGMDPELALITPSFRKTTRTPATLEWYQAVAESTAIYPGKGDIIGLMYVTLGLAGECGEIANKVKKVWRDNEGELLESTRTDLIAEMSDVLWYLSALCSELGIELSYVAQKNLDKLMDRASRDVIHGSGDTR